MVRRKSRLAILILASILVFSGCSAGHLKIPKVVSDYLDFLGVKQSGVLKVDKEGVKEFSPLPPDLGNYNSKLTQAVLDVVECDFSFEDRQFAKIRKGDFVSLELKIVKKGERIYQDEVGVVVGLGLFDPLIEAWLVGKSAENRIDWEIDSSSNPALAQYVGQTVQIDVSSVSSVEEMEDTKEHLSQGGYSNFEEYYRTIYEMKCEELSFEHQASERDRFFRFLIEQCEYDISSEDIVAMSLQIVSEYEKQAQQFGMSLSEFYEEFLEIKEEDAFFYRCAEEGNYEIQKILAVGAVAKIYQIEIGNGERIDLGGESIIANYEELEHRVLEFFFS